MSNIFDLFNPARHPAVLQPMGHSGNLLQRASNSAKAEMGASSTTLQILSTATSRNTERVGTTHSNRSHDVLLLTEAVMQAWQSSISSAQLVQDTSEYLRDAYERLVLSLDTLRKRGDIFLDHEAQGCPPVLIYDHELVMDGRLLKYPSNYMLLRILPPKRVKIDNQKRPYIVIDPRAGHGPGIGGFKTDSQVGVALRAGHPVYFVAFRREPEPGQYLSYVTRAEAAFVREVMRRHPLAPKPDALQRRGDRWYMDPHAVVRSGRGRL